MNSLVIITFISLLILISVESLCHEDQTFDCTDQPGYKCCAILGETECTCAEQGWHHNNQNLPGQGCPVDRMWQCSYVSDDVYFSACCPLEQNNGLKSCDITTDSAVCEWKITVS